MRRAACWSTLMRGRRVAAINKPCKEKTARQHPFTLGGGRAHDVHGEIGGAHNAVVEFCGSVPGSSCHRR